MQNTKLVTYINRVPSSYYWLKTFFSHTMQIWQFFNILKWPVHISVNSHCIRSVLKVAPRVVVSCGIIRLRLAPFLSQEKNQYLLQVLKNCFQINHLKCKIYCSTDPKDRTFYSIKTILISASSFLNQSLLFIISSLSKNQVPLCFDYEKIVYSVQK